MKDSDQLIQFVIGGVILLVMVIALQEYILVAIIIAGLYYLNNHLSGNPRK